MELMVPPADRVLAPPSVSEEGTPAHGVFLLYPVWWLRNSSYHLLWYVQFCPVPYTESCSSLQPQLQNIQKCDPS